MQRNIEHGSEILGCKKINIFWASVVGDGFVSRTSYQAAGVSHIVKYDSKIWPPPLWNRPKSNHNKHIHKQSVMSGEYTYTVTEAGNVANTTVPRLL